MRALGIALGSALVLVGCGDDEPRPTGGGDLGYPRIATYRLGGFLDEDARSMVLRTPLALLDVELGALDPEGLAALGMSPRELLASLPAMAVLHDENATLHPLADARFSRVQPAAWVLEPGSTTVGVVSSSDTRIRVTDPAAFSLVRTASAFHPAGGPTYLAIGGEHVRLVAIEADELVVERGVHSAATMHSAGSRIAAHVALFAGTWLVDVNAMPWRDAIVTEAQALVLAGPWTGIALDACIEDLGAITGSPVDLDRNGIADDAAVAAAAWGSGVAALVTSLREVLGPDARLVANARTGACAHEPLDGIVLPGFPVGAVPQVPPIPYDATLERYVQWTSRTGHPPLSIANAYAVAPTDYAPMRLGLATALLGDGYYAFDNGAHDVAWWFDEYDGAGRGRGWLGHPQGPPTRVSGSIYVRTFTRGMVIANPTETPVQITVPPGFRKLLGTQDPDHNDGEEVTGPLVIAGRDAYLLTR